MRFYCIPTKESEALKIIETTLELGLAVYGGTDAAIREAIYNKTPMFTGADVALAYSDLTNSLIRVGKDYTKRGAARLTVDQFIPYLKGIAKEKAQPIK